MNAGSENPTGGMPQLSNADMMSVVALASHEATGVIGEELSLLPNWMLKAADRWAEQDAEYQTKHNDVHRLPFPNPWRYLLDAPDVSEKIKEVCRGAQSQLYAYRKLARMAIGGASLNTDWAQKALEARAREDKVGFITASAKTADSLVQFDFVQKSVRDTNDPDLLRSMEWWRNKRRKQLVHRGQGATTRQPAPKPSWTEIRNRFPVECCLVEGWITFYPSDIPGLMFWSNAAITKWLFARLERDPQSHKNLGRDYIKKVRQQLGLVPANDKCPLVWDITLKPIAGNQREITGLQNDGTEVFKYPMRAKRSE